MNLFNIDLDMRLTDFVRRFGHGSFDRAVKDTSQNMMFGLMKSGVGAIAGGVGALAGGMMGGIRYHVRSVFICLLYLYLESLWVLP